MEDSSEIIFDSGFTVPVTQVSLENVQDIVRAVCLQSTLLNVKAELDQMAEGLKLLNVISLLRQHPQKFKSLFVFDVDSVLTADQMVTLFDVAYSPQGSTKRVSEEATYMHWNEFLHDLAHGLVGRHMHTCKSLKKGSYYHFSPISFSCSHHHSFP